MDNQTYSSTTGGENALLVKGEELTLTNVTITKSGDSASEEADFYGTNAAVLATSGLLTLNGGTVTTDGAHANALFAYDSGSIVANNLKITTSRDNSGGIMVAGGGSITATDLTVATSGNSSAAIRSDRGGGVMNVVGGSYKTTGSGSPAVYSTANIMITDAELESTASEGVVVEGFNSVALFNTKLTDTNTVLHGNSETYKNVFIYQSMSGDAKEGTGSFYAEDSVITTNKGDTVFITNTTAEIELKNTRIINNDTSSALLRAEAGKWGRSGANGGNVTLTATRQVLEGDIILDNLSSLTMSLTESYYMGAINTENTASSASVSLDATSNLILTGDTYLSTLTNADSTNMNIYGSGYTLYVAGVAVATNSSEAPELPETIAETETETEETTVAPATSGADSSSSSFFSDNLPYIIGGGVLLVGIIVAVVLLILKKKKSTTQPDSILPPDLPPENPFATPYQGGNTGAATGAN